MGIQANQLRMGNFVDTINRSHIVHLPYGIVNQVGPIEFFKVRLYNVGNFALQSDYEFVDIIDLSPIPLTEEWLLKFGFELSGHSVMTLMLPPCEGQLNSLSELQYYIDTIQICRSGINAYSISCEYVHQLQNLYFALTGTELTIKI